MKTFNDLPHHRYYENAVYKKEVREWAIVRVKELEAEML
jgi:hypothetical protein